MQDKILDELQILTGVVSNDFDYLIYKLLENGNFFNSEEPKQLLPELTTSKYETLEDWFNKLERK